MLLRAELYQNFGTAALAVPKFATAALNFGTAVSAVPNAASPVAAALAATDAYAVIKYMQITECILLNSYYFLLQQSIFYYSCTKFGTAALPVIQLWYSSPVIQLL